jgi:hypothetical protein
MRDSDYEKVNGWTWRRPVVFWSILILAVLLALVCGYGRWAIEVLRTFRVTCSRAQRTADNFQPPQPALPPKETPIPPVDKRPHLSTSDPLARSNELEARAALVRLTGKQFPSIRPRWLTNPRSGRALECDCYNDELRLCIEVSGKQHYQHVPYFHRTADAFHYQLFKDKLKRSLLHKHGDQLIVVPYWVKRKDMEPFLRRELQRHGIKLRLVNVS